ncbi:MAG TPA: hypothetical protein PLC25_03590 [Bacilli bacterium]|nr:hypothetical protein [Bacilli bacterium]
MKKIIIVVVCLVFLTACGASNANFLGTYTDPSNNTVVIKDNNECSYSSYDSCEYKVISNKEIQITYTNTTKHVTVYDITSDGNLESKEGILLTKK